MLRKYIFILLFVFIGSTSKSDVFPREVDINAQFLFVPAGFDDNDEVIAVLDGYLPDPCHRLLRPIISIDYLFHRITIGPRARLYNGVCPDVTVPFTQEVRIGQLPKGAFTVVSKDGSFKEQLTVKRSKNPGPDDYLYAPVDSVRVEYPGGFNWIAVLEGRFTNSCLAIQETKVSLTGRTIQVLPIMKFQTEEECGQVCGIEEKPFKIEVPLPMLTEEGRYLLHVRSLNGQSVNEVFYRTPFNP